MLLDQCSNVEEVTSGPRRVTCESSHHLCCYSLWPENCFKLMIFHYIIESCFLSRSPVIFPPFQRHLADVGSVVVPVPHVGQPAGHHVVRCNENRLVRLPMTKHIINHSWGQFYGNPNLHFAAALSATFCLICLETSQGRIRLWWKILVIKNIKTRRSKI